MSSFLERIFGQVEPAPLPTPTQARALDPTDFETQLATLRNRMARQWRAASITEALGVPAIYRCVTLIANTVGSLALEAFRNGQRLPQDQAPRLIVRPNPFTTPREFFRDVSYCLATRGEALLWVAARDVDGVALSVYPMPPQEVTFEETVYQPLRPVIRWRNTQIPNEDVVHIVMSREPGVRRGSGPLQACGAAISVSVESQEWAANFFAMGGLPPALIKSAVKLSEQEAQDLKLQWAETANNMPKVIDPMIEDVKQLQWDEQAAQFNDARLYQVGDAARMFGIPGNLVEYSSPGSSLTYQNISEVYTAFLRTCLAPNYLEPIEQAMSDLLTRSTVARFNVDGLLRADIKTRFDVYESGVTKSGVLSLEEARQMEGLAPGDVEHAPIPVAVPQAIPDRLPIQQLRTLPEMRCPKCRRLNGEGYGRTICKKCGTMISTVDVA